MTTAPEFALGDRVRTVRLFNDPTPCDGTIRAIRTDENGYFYVVLFDLGGSAGRVASQLERI